MTFSGHRRSPKANNFSVIRTTICDFLLVVNSNLVPISYRLATIHTLQTDSRRQTPRSKRPDLQVWSRLKNCCHQISYFL